MSSSDEVISEEEIWAWQKIEVWQNIGYNYIDSEPLGAWFFTDQDYWTFGPYPTEEKALEAMQRHGLEE